MKEKIKKILIGYLPGFITGLIICGCVSVLAATYFPSNDVTYDNSVSGLQSTNVQGAIDELYGVCFPPLTGGDAILDQVDVVTSGDGLYEDEYEEGRYFYKGANPNNYITFNGETAGWRIISLEPDGSIKIMKIASIGNYAWDSSGSNDWSRPASLNTYLNGTYLTSLSQTAQNQIVSHNWSIGSVTYDNNDLAGQINDENSNKWTGKVGLATSSEYLRSNSNPGSCRSMSLINYNSSTCKSTTWMFNSANWWTLSPQGGYATDAFILRSYGSFDFYNLVDGSSGVRPVVYLSSSVTLSGSGISSNPYIIS